MRFQHNGATSVGGRAVGVLGTEIDVGYPKENMGVVNPEGKQYSGSLIVARLAEFGRQVFGVPGNMTKK